jgi:hypothetical protein
LVDLIISKRIRKTQISLRLALVAGLLIFSIFAPQFSSSEMLNLAQLHNHYSMGIDIGSGDGEHDYAEHVLNNCFSFHCTTSFVVGSENEFLPEFILSPFNLATGGTTMGLSICLDRDPPIPRGTFSLT